MTKILLIHPGHTFSTADVYDGLLVGLREAGVEVVEFRWGNILRTLGTLINAGVMQGVVSKENAPKLQEWAGWLAAGDTLTQALEQNIDAALVINGMLFPPDRVIRLRRLGVPVACYGTEAPYFMDAETAIAPAYSHWFTQERKCVDHFSDYVPTIYLPMAYNPATHQPAPPDVDHTCDVVFVGGGYPERKTLLDGADWNGVNLRTLGTLWDIDLDAERERFAQTNDRPGQSQTYSAGAIANTETTKWHQGAAISLNIHRTMTYVETLAQIDPTAAESVGPRAYEIPAVGGFQLCDDARSELFDIYGDSAATFRANDSADLSRQVRYWLAHPDARERTRAAQFEAVRPHTWTARARTVLEALIP